MLNSRTSPTVVIPFPARGDQSLFACKRPEQPEFHPAEEAGFISLMSAPIPCTFHVFADDELECILMHKCSEVFWSNLTQDIIIGESL